MGKDYTNRGVESAIIEGLSTWTSIDVDTLWHMSQKIDGFSGVVGKFQVLLNKRRDVNKIFKPLTSEEARIKGVIMGETNLAFQVDRLEYHIMNYIKKHSHTGRVDDIDQDYQAYLDKWDDLIMNSLTIPEKDLLVMKQELSDIINKHHIENDYGVK